MAKRRGASHSGEGQYTITQANLDKKGKTNKKIKKNPLASKYLSAKGRELIEQAKAYAEAHPAGSGRRYKRNMQKIEEKVASAS